MLLPLVHVFYEIRLWYIVPVLVASITDLPNSESQQHGFRAHVVQFLHENHTERYSTPTLYRLSFYLQRLVVLLSF